MKSVKFLLAAALILVGATSAMAQQKFAVVNAQEVMTAMPQFDSMKVKMQKVEQQLGDEMQANEKEYTAKVQEYTKNKDNYSEAIRAQKEKEINSIMQRIQEFEQVAQREYQEQQEKLMAPIRQKLVDAITKVGNDNSFLFVFEKNSALYVSPTLVVDATPLVRAALGLK